MGFTERIYVTLNLVLLISCKTYYAIDRNRKQVTLMCKAEVEKYQPSKPRCHVNFREIFRNIREITSLQAIFPAYGVTPIPCFLLSH